ncbi:MAG: hypothetical protein N4J56_006882 [Chroococcidiopsis sp. SAG 2025]|nr:hypothetical protein [Chroococcidiopsis sp. SAG 2025]
MQVNPSVFSSGSMTSPATYVPVTTRFDSDILLAAETYLRNPILANKLTERVYDLLLTDLQSQQERLNNYRRTRI